MKSQLQVQYTHSTFYDHYTSQPASASNQLTTGRFCWSKVLLPTCSCWQQLVHLDYREDTMLTTQSPYHEHCESNTLLQNHLNH